MNGTGKGLIIRTGQNVRRSVFVLTMECNGVKWDDVLKKRCTFERVEEFKYLGTTLTNQNSIAEEIKSRLRSGNACHHSVQNLLSSRLLSKKFKDQEI